MYLMLIALLQFNFCYLLRLTIISGAHGAFSLSTNVHVQDSPNTRIVKKSRKFQYWIKKLSCKMKNLYTIRVSYVLNFLL